MFKPCKYTHPSQKRSYNLSYHLRNSDSLRLEAKVRKIIKIIPEKYFCEVVFTKRRIRFIKVDKKFIQLIVEEQRILLKIKTDRGWLKIRLPDWEGLGRTFDIIEKQSILLNL